MDSERKQTTTSIRQAEDSLRKQLEELLKSSIDLSDLANMIAELQKAPEEARLSELARIRRDLDAALSDWASFAATPQTEDREKSEEDVRSAQSQLVQWQAGHGANLSNLVGEVSTMFPELQLPSSTNPELARTTSLRAAEKELARCVSLLDEDQRSSARILQHSIDSRSPSDLSCISLA